MGVRHISAGGAAQWGVLASKHKALGSVTSTNDSKVNGAGCSQPCNPSIWEAGVEGEDVMVSLGFRAKPYGQKHNKKNVLTMPVVAV